MIDFHTHILPGIDDGSRNVEMSVQMLHEELKDSVDHVVCPPHFYANHDSIEHFLKRRGKSIGQLMVEIEKDEKLSRMKYEFGAEVYYFTGIGNAVDICQWTDAMYEDIGKLLHKQELTIVLAHIERYIDFQKKKDVWNRIFELPVIAQMNAGPFIRWSGRSKVIKLAKSKRHHFAGQ